MYHAGVWTEGQPAAFRTEGPENFLFLAGCGNMIEETKSLENRSVVYTAEIKVIVRMGVYST